MNARAIPLFGILLLGVTSVATAQNRLPSIPQTLSLQDAIDLAETYSPTCLATSNDRSPAAGGGSGNAYASLLPTLTASSRATYRGAGTQRFLTTGIHPTFCHHRIRLQPERELDTSAGTLCCKPGVQKAALSAGGCLDRRGQDDPPKQHRATILDGAAKPGAGGAAGTAGGVRRREPAAFAGTFRRGANDDDRRAPGPGGQGPERRRVAASSPAVTVEVLRFFQQMGVPAPADPTVVALSDTFPVVEPDWSLDELLTEADAYNPDVGALRARETSAEWNERSVKSQWLPSFKPLRHVVGLHPAIYKRRFPASARARQSGRQHRRVPRRQRYKLGSE